MADPVRVDDERMWAHVHSMSSLLNLNLKIIEMTSAHSRCIYPYNGMELNDYEIGMRDTVSNITDIEIYLSNV